jgi:hypothetical protein
LRARGAVEGRRQALEKFQEVVALSKIKRDKSWEIVALLSSGLICEELGEIQNALNFYEQGLTLARASGAAKRRRSTISATRIFKRAITRKESIFCSKVSACGKRSAIRAAKPSAFAISARLFDLRKPEIFPKASRGSKALINGFTSNRTKRQLPIWRKRRVTKRRNRSPAAWRSSRPATSRKKPMIDTTGKIVWEAD